MKRIHLISGPRNISTALMYSFAQRKDTSVVDEPFYAYYLQYSGVDHPGREETLASMSADPEEVIDTVIFGDYPTEAVFFKNMAKHLVGVESSFCEKLQNVFLIRDPARLITSFAKVVPQIEEAEIGLKHACELFKQMSTATARPIVLNSDILLANPAQVLEKLCAALGLPFDAHMLHWQAGARPEDGVWAPYWYANVHKSTGFQPYHPATDPFPAKYQVLLEEVLPYYNYLNQYSIS